MFGSKTVKSSHRERLIEKYRDINIECNDWYEGVYSVFQKDMKAVGIDVRQMYFTGFWSQGDGACFSGELDDALKYLDHHHKGEFPMIRKLLEHGGRLYVQCEHSGRYYHENCTSFSVDSTCLHDVLPTPTEFHEQVVEKWDLLLDEELSAFEEAVTKQWRTYMTDLYDRLETEYDYLTSDEAVWEAIEADELDDDYEEEDD